MWQTGAATSLMASHFVLPTGINNDSVSLVGDSDLEMEVRAQERLAWLALAAERKDEAFETSLAAAWDEATPDEHNRANEIWRELAKKYADAVTLQRAQNHFDLEVSQITGSRVGMPGHVVVWTRTKGNVDGAVFKAQWQQLAERNFGKLPVGTVDVRPLEPVIDDASRE